MFLPHFDLDFSLGAFFKAVFHFLDKFSKPVGKQLLWGKFFLAYLTENFAM